MAPHLRRLEEFFLRNINRRLLAYGVLVALLGTVWLAVRTPDPWLTLTARSDGIRGSVLARDDGKPLLTARLPRGRPGQPKAYGAPELADDPGIFVYSALLGHAIGSSDPTTLLRILFLGLFAVPLALYPVLFWRLFASVATALFAPLGLLFGLSVLERIQPLDIYWIGPWAIFSLLVPVLAIDLGWRRGGGDRARPLLLLTLLMLAASFASSIRIHSGLPILIAAIISVATGPPWRAIAKAGACALLIAAYLAITPLGMNALRSNRDDNVRLSSGAGGQQALSSHVFWHSAFIGLGYLPNPYGLRYKDEVGATAAQKESPSVRFASKEYERTIRRLYFRFLKRHPGFVLELTAKKVAVAVAWAAPMLLVLLLALPGVLRASEHGTRIRRFLLLLSPALAIFLLPPALTTPDVQYDLAWLGAVGLLSLLVVAALVASVSPEAASGSRSAFRALLQSLDYGRASEPDSRQRRTRIALVVGGVLTVIALSVVSVHVRNQAADWNEGPLPIPSQLRV